MTVQGQQQQGPDYYPFSLGLEGAGDPRKYAFLISGKDDKRVSTQGEVLILFLKHGAKIISQWGYLDEARHDFVLCLKCDMSNADITPDGLILELRLSKFIRNVRSRRMENRLFHGFSFPVTFLDNRVVILDSQITFLIEQQLKTPEQRAALVEVGRIYALDIVRQIRAKFPRNSPEQVIFENALEYFKAVGIGRFSLFDADEKSVQAIIRDPPLSHRGEATGNHFIHGIVVGLVEAFQERGTIVTEDLYDRKTGRLFISVLNKENEPISEQSSAIDVKLKALEEVEKVISSIEGPKKDLQMPSTVVSTGSTATLKQVLKTYEHEGWVGGKIGYVPEVPKEHSSPPIVVKYNDSHTSADAKQRAVTQSIVATKAPANAVQEDPSKKSSQISSKVPETKPKKKIAEDEDEDDDKLTRAFKSVMVGDSLYFEDSYFLE